MEHKLIMENWRKYKKSLDERAGGMTGLAVGTTAHDAIVEDEYWSEFFEVVIECIVIGLTNPNKVMNSPKLWSILQRFGMTQEMMRRWAMDGNKTLPMVKRNAIKALRSVSGALEKIGAMYLTGAGRYSAAEIQAAFIAKCQLVVQNIFGVALKVGSVLWLAYEVYLIAFGTTSKIMKMVGLRNYDDEVGNYNIKGLVKDWYYGSKGREATWGDVWDKWTDAEGKKARAAYLKSTKTEEEFDHWEKEEQVAWCLGFGDGDGKVPKNYKGTVTCEMILDMYEGGNNQEDKDMVARLRKEKARQDFEYSQRVAGPYITDSEFPMSVRAKASKTDPKIAMSVPARD